MKPCRLLVFVSFLTLCIGGPPKLIFYRSIWDTRGLQRVSGHVGDSERFLCYDEHFLREHKKNLKSLPPKEESTLVNQVSTCKIVGGTAASCIIGSEAAFSAYMQQDIAYLFFDTAVFFCAEIYTSYETAEDYLMVVPQRKNYHIGDYLVQNGRIYNLTQAVPFITVLKNSWGGESLQLFSYDSCPNKDKFYSPLIRSTKIFGMKKSGINSKFTPPHKTFFCSLTRAKLAFHSLPSLGDPETDHVAWQVSSCLSEGDRSCVLGVDETIQNFLKGNLIALLLTSKSAIMTSEFVDSLTGETRLIHAQYTPELRDQDNFMYGRLQHFKTCVPFAEYLIGRSNQTLIVPFRSCAGSFDEYELNAKYGGIAGILLLPSPDTKGNSPGQSSYDYDYFLPNYDGSGDHSMEIATVQSFGFRMLSYPKTIFLSAVLHVVVQSFSPQFCM